MSHGVEVLTGGTDVHLVLVDLGPTGLDGKTAEQRLEQVGITVNRNAIPFDERPPMNPSGLRIGTPALTTRGLVEDDLREIAEVIAIALSDSFDAEREARPGWTGSLMGGIRSTRSCPPRPSRDAAAAPSTAGSRRRTPRGISSGPLPRSPGCGTAPWRRPQQL